MSQQEKSSAHAGWVTSIEELKALGSFRDVKKDLCSELGFRVSARGWDSLFQKLVTLRESVMCHSAEIEQALQSKSTSSGRSQLQNLLGIRIPGRTRAALKRNVDALMQTFCRPRSALSPYERYEQTRWKNFRSSSKLEDITIPDSNSNHSLEDILAAYRAH